MPAKKRRKRVTASKQDAQKFPAGDFTLTLREIKESKDGYTWSTYLVQGWKEGKSWKRRKFKEKGDAEAFIYRKQVELANDSGASHRVISRLTQEQLNEAEDAIHRLGDRYSLREAVDFFMLNFCEPDYTISIEDARRKFLIGKENEGVRDRSIKQLESTITRFGGFVDNIDLHLVTSNDVERFLRSLRARDGVAKASKKTWNNYRADLSSFFSWCCESQRRWIASNPAASVSKFKKIDRDIPEILTPAATGELMVHLESFADGKLSRYFALALFAGIRTGPEGELYKLARHPEREKLIDLKRGVINIPPDVSKTGQKRQVMIRENLRFWLKRTGPEILPVNHDRLLKTVRKDFKLGHDVLRHSFITYHVAAFRSIGDAAIEAGNTEAVTKKHYLNMATKTEGEAFWNVTPENCTVTATQSDTNLKVA